MVPSFIVHYFANEVFVMQLELSTYSMSVLRSFIVSGSEISTCHRKYPLLLEDSTYY
jgi:hypothetical protein